MSTKTNNTSETIRDSEASPESPAMSWSEFCRRVMVKVEDHVITLIEEIRAVLDAASADEPIQCWQFTLTQDSRNYLVYHIMDTLFGFARHGHDLEQAIEDKRFQSVLEFLVNEEQHCFIRASDRVEYFSILANRMLRLSNLIDFQQSDETELKGIPDNFIPTDPVDALLQFYPSEGKPHSQPSFEDSLYLLQNRVDRARIDNASNDMPDLTAIQVLKECYENLTKFEKRMEKLVESVKAGTQQVLQRPEDWTGQVVELFAVKIFFIPPPLANDDVLAFFQVQANLRKMYKLKDQADAEACQRCPDFVPLVKETCCLPDSLLGYIEESCRKQEITKQTQGSIEGIEVNGGIDNETIKETENETNENETNEAISDSSVKPNSQKRTTTNEERVETKEVSEKTPEAGEVSSEVASSNEPYDEPDSAVSTFPKEPTEIKLQAESDKDKPNEPNSYEKQTEPSNKTESKSENAEPKIDGKAEIKIDEIAEPKSERAEPSDGKAAPRSDKNDTKPKSEIDAEPKSEINGTEYEYDSTHKSETKQKSEIEIEQSVKEIETVAESASDIASMQSIDSINAKPDAKDKSPSSKKSTEEESGNSEKIDCSDVEVKPDSSEISASPNSDLDSGEDSSRYKNVLLEIVSSEPKSCIENARCVFCVNHVEKIDYSCALLGYLPLMPVLTVVHKLDGA